MRFDYFKDLSLGFEGERYEIKSGFKEDILRFEIYKPVYSNFRYALSCCEEESRFELLNYIDASPFEYFIYFHNIYVNNVGEEE